VILCHIYPFCKSAQSIDLKMTQCETLDVDTTYAFQAPFVSTEKQYICCDSRGGFWLKSISLASMLLAGSPTPEDLITQMTGDARLVFCADIQEWLKSALWLSTFHDTEAFLKSVHHNQGLPDYTGELAAAISITFHGKTLPLSPLPSANQPFEKARQSIQQDIVGSIAIPADELCRQTCRSLLNGHHPGCPFWKERM
jgi:hypothetical protein